jgi:autophagy-related protein 9
MIRPGDDDEAPYTAVESLELDLERGGGGARGGEGGRVQRESARAGRYAAVAAADDEPGWVGAGDLDDFFSAAYAYHYESGFYCMATKAVVNTLTLGFTIVFSTFLLGFVDWPGLLACKNEATCFEFGHYVVSLGAHSSFFFRAFVVLYCILFSAFWLWSVAALGPALRRMWDMHRFFTKVLGVSTRELQTMEWCEVVERMVALQEAGEHPIQINGLSFSAKDVAMRIMRKHNYLVAIVNEEVLPLGTLMLDRERWFMGKCLELMLELCVLNHLFDAQHLLRRDWGDASLLRRRLQTVGVLNLLAMPFSLGFLVIYSFLKHAEEWHSKRSYLGPRWWSPYALWELREYNELPHLFERRTTASVRHADEYLRQFPAPLPTVVAGGVSFVAGAFVGVLMLFTLLDESILLHIKLGGRDLVWYIAIFSAVLAVSRSLVPPMEAQPQFAPQRAFKKVVAFTHYLPDRWRGRTHAFDTRDEFSDYLPYKVVLLLRELACVITAPYVLGVVLPRHCEQLIAFVRARTRNVKGVGDVCVYSELRLDEFGDERYGSERAGAGTSAAAAPSGAFTPVPERARVRGGKLEKSWLNFRLSYPQWRDAQGYKVHDVISRFQRGQVEASLERSAEDLVTTGTSQLAAAVMSASFAELPDTSARLERVAQPASAATGTAADRRASNKSNQLSHDAGDDGNNDNNNKLNHGVEMFELGRADTRNYYQHNLRSDAAGLSVLSRSSASGGALAERPFFDDSALRPLEQVRYPNHEHYYWWLEELRDANEAEHPLASHHQPRAAPSRPLA